MQNSTWARKTPSLFLRLASSAGNPLADTVSKCEANDQSDCNFEHRGPPRQRLRPPRVPLSTPGAGRPFSFWVGLLFRQRSNRTLAQPDRIALTSLCQLDDLFCNDLGRGIGSIGQAQRAQSLLVRGGKDGSGCSGHMLSWPTGDRGMVGGRAGPVIGVPSLPCGSQAESRRSAKRPYSPLATD